jgi:ATP-dependent RNA helicase RhlE
MQSSAPSASVSGFDRFPLRPSLRRAITAVGYREPRPIQEQTIPAVLAGRDVLGLAQTGTGKTAAFAIPIIDRLAAAPGPGPRTLVVAPTRELAVQIDAEFRSLARWTRLRTVTVYGGVPDRAQIQELRRGTDVVVACPGRLLDLHRRGAVRLDRIEMLVLDEADHMFDMGFLPDVRRILAALPVQRQNLLFSATMPSEIRALADQVLTDPVVSELPHSTPVSTIEHALYPVPETRKMDLLEHFFSQDGFVSAIVFTRTKHRAKRLAERIGKKGHKAVALQGNMSQGQRDRALRGFRSRRFDILVATDIASRGLDVEQISHVINFDVPNTPDAYTHRIGRTGRSERSGKACTFVTENDAEAVRAIERTIGATIPRGRVAGFEEVVFPSSPPRPRHRHSASRPARVGPPPGKARRAPRNPGRRNGSGRASSGRSVTRRG